MMEELSSWSNLLRAFRCAARGKRGHPDVAAFEHRLEDEVASLSEELRDRQYSPGAYHSFHVHEPKRRLISAAPFRDRVVHHALCQVIGPTLERSFVEDSFASRVGKGTLAALDALQRHVRRFRFALACDVRQFFPSIDHAILRARIARRVFDDGALWLVDRILASGAGVLSGEYRMVWFPGDDLFAAVRPRGLPIGNLTSQMWANVYLDPVDHFVKREVRCGGYVRYVDDFVLLDDDAGKLAAARVELVERLARLRLTLHAGAHVRPVQEGIPFLGFVTRPEGRRLKSRCGLAFRRRLRALAREVESGSVPFERLAASVQGWVEHVRRARTTGLRQAVLGSHGAVRLGCAGGLVGGPKMCDHRADGGTDRL